jgi:predicted PurR-regulated permease PerM
MQSEQRRPAIAFASASPRGAVIYFEQSALNLPEAVLKDSLNERSESIRLWTHVIVRVTIMLVAILVAAWFLYTIRTVLLLLILSVFFCYMLFPLVRLFEYPIYVGRREVKVSRTFAIASVYLLLGIILFFGFRMLWPMLWEQMTELAKNLPDYIKRGSDSINNATSGANSWMRHLRLPPQWREYVGSYISEWGKQALPWLETMVTSLVSYVPYLTWLILVPILSFFFLRDASSFEQTFVAVLPQRLQRRVQYLLGDLSQTLAYFIRAQIIACLVVGILASVGFFILDAPYPLVLGAMAGIMEFVPLVGPLIAGSIAVGLTLTTRSVQAGLIVAAFLIILRLVEDYIIYPRIVGHGIKIHPLVVILAILAGAEVGGLVGVFLSIPTVGLAMVVYNHYVAYRGIQNMRVVMPSGQPPTEEEVRIASTEPTSPILETK